MRRSLALALLAVLASLAVACRPAGPRDIALGQEQCAFCRMTITDAKFAAEVRTARGRLEAFDSAECAASYVRAAQPGTVDAVWVSDYNAPGTFVSAESATFWVVPGASPMGRGVIATSGAAPRGLTAPDSSLRWPDVLALVATPIANADGRVHAH